MINLSKNTTVIPQVSGANVYFSETLGLGLGLGLGFKILPQNLRLSRFSIPHYQMSPLCSTLKCLYKDI